jgi:heterodisulfide reductase subunit D
MKQIIRRTKAYYCVECGKCSGACPVARVNEGFSPRLIVEKALSGLKGEIEGDRELWTCLTCEACTSKCPSTVKYSDFIRGMRSSAFNSGYTSRCSQGGLLHSIQKVQSYSGLVQNRLDWVTDDLKTSSKGEVLYFTGCLSYLENLFSSFVNPIEIARSTVKILNTAGIIPAVSPNERCCGHDLLWTGDVETFQKLARLNIGIIKESGASRIVTSCPECYRTLKVDYADFLDGTGIEIMHISEFISSIIKNNEHKLDNMGKMTYHDPCRLGRHMGIYDAPREVIKGMGELVEMNKNREESSCCGVSAWATCEGMSKQMQVDRLIEAKSTGADMLITSCPKCLTHLRCAVHNQIPVEKEKVDIPVVDLAVAACRALTGG